MKEGSEILRDRGGLLGVVQKKEAEGPPAPVTHKLADFREEARRETGIPTIPNEEITARARLGGEKAKSKLQREICMG